MNAHRITRISLARAKGEHLQAVNEPSPDGRVGLMNPAFKYTRSIDTDIRQLFNRVRREQAQRSQQ
jgi:hypothetical protein